MSGMRFHRLGEGEYKPLSDLAILERETCLAARIRPITRTRWLTRRISVAVCLLFSIIGLIEAFNHDTVLDNLPGQEHDINPHRIAKVSMLYGKKNDLYERALQSHIRHADKWGYPTWVATSDEYCGYWNKPTFIISKVAQELAKPEKERMNWLMWVDADSIILNPNIPAHIFLPPKEHSHIHFVGARDVQGLNTGVFFVRVHLWTITMLVDSMAFPICNADVDLGNDADQAAMARTFEKTKGGHDGTGFKDGIVFQPQSFFNAYELPGFQREGRDDLLRDFPGFNSSHGYQGKRGDFLVHLPGLFGDRDPFMTDWLDLIENRPEDWVLPLKDTTYVQDTQAFWEMYGNAMKTLEEASKKQHISSALAEAIKVLKDGLSEEADNTQNILNYTTEVKKLLVDNENQEEIT